MILAFLCKTVATGQIAVMGNVQAQRFYHCFPLLEIRYILLINVLRKQLFHVDKLLDVFQNFCNLCIRIFAG